MEVWGAPMFKGHQKRGEIIDKYQLNKEGKHRTKE